MPDTALIVMAAGIGSRYGGLKQMDPVGPAGEKIIDYSVYDARRAGFEQVVFVIRKEMEEDFREHIGRRIEQQIETLYVYQELRPLPEGFTVNAEIVIDDIAAVKAGLARADFATLLLAEAKFLILFTKVKAAIEFFRIIFEFYQAGVTVIGVSQVFPFRLHVFSNQCQFFGDLD